MLRVGLVGAGLITDLHLIAWSRQQDAAVVAICDPAVERAEARAREFGISKAYASVEAMLAAEQLDALDVASPRETHAKMVRLAAARGLHVLCQKPFVTDVAEAEQLIREVGKTVRVMVHQNWRFRPAYRQISGWIRDGKLGRPRAVQVAARSAAFLPDAEGHIPALKRQPFMARLDDLVVSEMLIHHLDLLRFLVGPMTVVWARLGRTCPAIKGADRATIVLEGGSGLPVVVEGDFAVPGHGPRSVDRFEIFGTKGAARFVDMKLMLGGEETIEVSYEPAMAYQQGFDDCFRHFVEALRTGQPFETPPEENLGTLRLVEEIVRRAGPIVDFSDRRRTETDQPL